MFDYLKTNRAYEILYLNQFWMSFTLKILKVLIMTLCVIFGVIMLEQLCLTYSPILQLPLHTNKLTNQNFTKWMGSKLIL